MAKKQTDATKKVMCPLCMMMDALNACADQHSEFVKHMRNARIEFLEGVKSVIESHIDDLQQKNKSGSGSFKKVEVTE